MWKVAFDHIAIGIDDNNDDEQLKPSSVEIAHLSTSTTQSSLAPLVSFDENGDIPFHAAHRSSSRALPNSQHNTIDDCCLNFSSWKRFRTDFCHLFFQFLFSQVGLSILVVIYVMFGGLIFYTIESRYEWHKNEQIKREHSRGIRNIRHIATDEFNWMLNASFELRYALWRGMMSRQDGYDDIGWRVFVSSERFDKLIDDELARMQAEQEKLTDKHDTRTDVAYNQKWTFSTAMLYSATVITTVGYGNIAPKSILGKYYSLTINFLERIIQHRQKRQWKRKKISFEIENDFVQRVPVAATLGVLALYIVAGAVLFSHWEGWSYVDGAYFSFITFTTIGLGDLVPGKGTLTENKNGKSILCAIYLLFGLVLTAMCFKLMQDDLFAMKQRLFARLGFDTHNNTRDEEPNIPENIKGHF